ncbi:Hypothetical protein, putative, partial [Bodo saltans]
MPLDFFLKRRTQKRRALSRPRTRGNNSSNTQQATPNTTQYTRLPPAQKMGTTCSIDAFDDKFSEPAADGASSSSTRASPVRSKLHPAGPPSSYHQQYHQQFLKAEGSDYIS